MDRYASLQGHGYQAALTNKGFDVLLRKMGVKMECFASPLNCRYSRFCSGMKASAVPIELFVLPQPHDKQALTPCAGRPILQ